MRIDKRKILTGVLLAWFVLSASYISWGISKNVSDAIFVRGYTAAVYDIMNQAENEQCIPFPIFLDERVAELINIECLEFADGE